MTLLDRLRKTDSILSRAMPLIPIMGLILGASFPAFFQKLVPLVPWLFGCMTLSGALRLRAGDLGRAASSPLPFLLYILSTRIIMPLTVFLLSPLIFGADREIISGMILTYSAPTAVTGFIWVTVFKGDIALALALILMDTILAPFVVPATVRLLLGTSISIDVMGMALSLLYMIVIPTIIGITLNETSKGKIPVRITPWLSPLSKLLMIPVIAANSSALAPQIHPANRQIWLIFAVCICFNIFGFLCGKTLSMIKKLSREKQITIFFATGLRNNSIAMILATQFFPASAALPSVLGIMTQHTIAGLLGRGIFGRLLAGKKALETDSEKSIE